MMFRKAAIGMALAVVLLFVASALGQDVSTMPNAEKGHPNLESRLDQLVKAYQTAGMRGAESFAHQIAIELINSLVRVEIEAKTPNKAQIDGLIKKIEDFGGKFETRYESLIQALVPIEALGRLANLSEIRFVQLPITPAPDQGGIISQGVGVIGADKWQRAGITGQGVKVAVVDLGFQGLSSVQARGELPPNIIARVFRGDGNFEATVHGTGVAEIVFDVAPAAQFFAVAVNTNIELLNAVDWLMGQKVDTINTSLSWEPVACVGEGEGVWVGRITRPARDSGILWISSAGNDARRHWEGDFRDGDNDGILNFTADDETQTIEARQGSVITVTLSWDDGCRSSSNDYDLFLLDSNMREVARSTNIQDGNDLPWERLDFRIPSSGIYHIVVRRTQATGAAHLDLFCRCARLEYPMASRSIGEPAYSSQVLAVGATFWQDARLEDFSSQGPTRDGRIKPDLTAPDGVANVSYSRGFFGTSASAPHVAGAAALVKQAFPTFTPDQIQQFLEQRAEDLGPPGKDNQYGAGLLQLGQPPGSPRAPTELQAIARGPREIALSWEDNADNEDGFKVERRLQTEPNFSEIASVGPNVTIYTDATVSPATAYCYRVQAFNRSGDSDYSNEACVTTPAAVPAAPTDLTAAAVSPTQIDLRWEDNSNNEDGFKIERKTQGGEFAQIAQVAADVTSFSDTGLTPNTTHVYRVRAFNAAGDSPYSNEASATTLPPPNRRPIADAGPDQTVTVGSSVQLDGSNSKDPDGDPISFRWRFLTRPPNSNATFSDPNRANPAFVADVAGEYVAELVVNDGKEDSEPDTVKITAIPQPAGTLLALKFIKLEFVTPAVWERTLRERCVAYRKIGTSAGKLKITLPDNTALEFDIGANKEVFVCGDVAHIDTRGAAMEAALPQRWTAIPSTLRQMTADNELLPLKFIKLEFVEPAAWERTLSGGFVIYKNAGGMATKSRVTRPDNSVLEFDISVGKAVLVCSDIALINA